MNQLIQSKNFTTIIVSALASVCFGLLPKARDFYSTAGGD
jgi:hypothetical protein